MLCVASVFAQAPEKFSYQAVVRNATNQLVANANVGVRMSVPYALYAAAAGNVPAFAVTPTDTGYVLVLTLPQRLPADLRAA